jgi:hypothetical protein
MRSLRATRATKKVKKFAAENSAEPQWFIVHSTEPIKCKKAKKCVTVEFDLAKDQ